MPKEYTPQQQELFSKVIDTFNRLNMSGQKDTNEKVNFRKGELKMAKIDGQVMLEYKAALKPFKSASELEKFLDSNLEYYMNKIEGKIMSVASDIPKIEKFSIRQTGETEGEYTIYDIDTNADVADEISAAKLILNDLMYDSRVVKMISSLSNVDVILVNGIEVDKEQLMDDLAVAAKEGVEIVELTSTPTPSRDKISDAWVDGLEYKGTNVFKAVYEDSFNQEEIDNEVKDLNSMVDATKENFSVQECYLGYSPSKDEFIMGFDGWYTVMEEDEDGEEEEYNDNCSPYVIFGLKDGVVSIIESSVASTTGMWYHGGGWSYAKSKYPDLIDIRLD